MKQYQKSPERILSYSVSFFFHLPSCLTAWEICVIIIGISIAHTFSQDDTIRIMSYNVENLFDLVDNGTEYTEYKPFTHNWNKTTHDKKLDNIASVICAAHPDIAILCEVENQNAVKELQQTLSQKNQKFPYLGITSQTDGAETQQVILSKLPVIAAKTSPAPSINTVKIRPILEADVAIAQNTLKIFAVHFPSKAHPESWRVAAAAMLAQRLQKLPKSTDYIIAGDFNSDYNEAETFFTDKLDDTRGTTGINHILKTVRSGPQEFLEYVSKQDLAGCEDSLYHYDPWLDLPEYKRFSYIHNGRNNTLDHILLGCGLFDATGLSYLDNSFTVFSWNGRLLYSGVPFRWNVEKTKLGKFHTGEGYSDHLPVIIRLVTKPFLYATRTGTSPKLNTRNSKPGLGAGSGFETGFEGWILANHDFKLFRDTISPFEGRFCLNIFGQSAKNSSAASIRIPAYTCNKRKLQTLSLVMRGSGKIAIRIRTEENSSLYYSGPKFSKKMKSCTYSDFIWKNWQSVAFTLSDIQKNQDAVELEIRSAGKELLCLWIDNVLVGYAQ